MPHAHFIKEEHLMECVKNKFLQLVVKTSIITTIMPPGGKMYDLKPGCVAYSKYYIKKIHNLEAIHNQ